MKITNKRTLNYFSWLLSETVLGLLNFQKSELRGMFLTWNKPIFLIKYYDIQKIEIWIILMLRQVF
jgi:hypothetical protein